MAVVVCAVAAGLALLAASRGWTVSEAGSVPGRPGTVDSTSRAAGGSWLSALALVSLAGAGAMVAVRRLARRLLGGLLAVCGTGIVGAAVIGLNAGRPVGWAVVAIAAGLVIAASGGYAVRRAADWPAMGSRFERAAGGTGRSGTRDVASADGPDAHGPDAGGRAPDGLVPDGLVPDGLVPDGRALDGRALDGRAPDGRALDGRAPDGRALDGRAPDGRAPGGRLRPASETELWDAIDRGEDPTR